LIVADASLMTAWLLNENDVVVAEDVYDMLAEETLLVPAHWPLEIGNALAMNLRRGRIPRETLATIEDRLESFVIVVQPAMAPGDIGPLVAFATEHKLTTYDACYVQLAGQNNAALATLDADMRAAAKRLAINLLPA
jgi:predicted nucleic acid-binding protein